MDFGIQFCEYRLSGVPSFFNLSPPDVCAGDEWIVWADCDGVASDAATAVPILALPLRNADGVDCLDGGDLLL